MPRYRWFALVTLASFVYYFIPGFLAQFLSVFAFMTWIFPKSPVVNQVFGGFSGLSMLPITFDWTQVAGFVGSPLMSPWSVAISGEPLLSLLLTKLGMPLPIHSLVSWRSISSCRHCSITPAYGTQSSYR